jgi:DNA polymerase elongation subunit (family B)
MRKNKPRRLALDIETSGLDPSIDQMLAVGLVGSEWEQALIGPERQILAELEVLLAQSSPTRLTTWNGSEFDMPFLANRYHVLGMTTELRTAPTGASGKYGNPLVRAVWGRHTHWDIAVDYQEIARQLSVPWHLKTVARELLALDPIEINDIANNIARLPEPQLRSYVLSDARITLQLAEVLRELQANPNDQVALGSH